MTQVVGTITNLRKVSGTSNAGKPYTINHIQVTGFEPEINIAFNREKLAVGHEFNANVMRNTYGDIVVGTGDVTAEPAVKAVPSTGGESFGNRKGINSAPYPVPADHPQNIIINQNSMAHATALVNGMLLSGVAEGLDINAMIDQRLDLALRIAPKIAAYSSGRLTQEAFNQLQDPELTEVLGTAVS